ncbi:MAG: hypothetical protein QGI31_02115 [Dehalococcoidia bacterium]|jgi:hypothetical protein|nr:hypothetical protein [Dehalococcoidia bacterium]
MRSSAVAIFPPARLNNGSTVNADPFFFLFPADMDKIGMLGHNHHQIHQASLPQGNLIDWFGMHGEVIGFFQDDVAPGDHFHILYLSYI